MSHWSQYRHRGRGANAGGQIPAPIASDWTCFANGTHVEVIGLTLSPRADVEGFRVSIRNHAAPTVELESFLMPADDDQTGVTVWLPGMTADVYVQWEAGGVPMSGLSDLKTIAF